MVDSKKKNVLTMPITFLYDIYFEIDILISQSTKKETISDIYVDAESASNLSFKLIIMYILEVDLRSTDRFFAQ